MEGGALGISVATIAMGGVVSGLVTFHLNARKEARQVRRTKLELAYRAFHGYTSQLGQHWVTLHSVMVNKIEYNDALDIFAKDAATSPLHFQELSMLVAIYFPELQPFVDRVIAVREMANDAIGRHKAAYKQLGPHVSVEGATVVAGLDELEVLEGDFTAAVREEARRINRGLGASV